MGREPSSGLRNPDHPYRMNFRRMASASNAACTGPRMVSIMTRLCAAFVAGRGSGFCKVITPRLYVSARGHLNDSPTSSLPPLPAPTPQAPRLHRHVTKPRRLLVAVVLFGVDREIPAGYRQ